MTQTHWPPRRQSKSPTRWRFPHLPWVGFYIGREHRSVLTLQMGKGRQFVPFFWRVFVRPGTQTFFQVLFLFIGLAVVAYAITYYNSYMRQHVPQYLQDFAETSFKAEVQEYCLTRPRQPHPLCEETLR